MTICIEYELTNWLYVITKIKNILIKEYTRVMKFEKGILYKCILMSSV